MLKHDHPLFHAVAREEWKDATPFSFEYRAYHHVYRHHFDGDSFGSSALFDPLFSHMFTAFAYLHHDFLGIRDVTSHGHHAMCCLFDTVQGLIIVGIIFCMFLLATHVTEWLEASGGSKREVIAKFGVTVGFVFWLFINGFILKTNYVAGSVGAEERGSREL